MNRYKIKKKIIKAQTYADAARIFLQDPDVALHEFPSGAGSLWLTRHRGYATIHVVPDDLPEPIKARDTLVLFNIIHLSKEG